MLELKNIKKVYVTGSEEIHALKGISLKFRKNEFVSILGPSGCGKTTMLNIIGGLDQYTEGDLLINHISTKEYKDRDWDAYRNYSIGFVFQSYNLIPHQTVLQNVELALTLSGVPKAERRKRAKKALEEVGLGSQMNKKPNEMSGGQCQRVAIARAIVNNPDIILADEPTGALDTETSVQVMDILKEISKDRLVIMVTHNPELAEKYSTRIVRMIDGEIKSDSAPLSEEEIQKEAENDKKKVNESKTKKKPSMSFATSFGLSLKNLFTKKSRTALTSFAGSIGIIGIALIYAVSHGMTAYIDTVQEETLSSYPLTIEASHIDMSSLINTFMGKAESEEEHQNDAVYQKAMIYDMMNSLNSLEESKNDLQSFKTYIEKQRNDKNSKLYTALSGVQYTYDTNLLIYTKNQDGDIILSDTQKLMTEMMSEYMGTDMSKMIEMRDQMSMGSTSMMTASSQLWKEILSGDNGKSVNPVIEKQYDIVYGRFPSRYDEIILFLDENNELDDLTLYALGLKKYEDIQKLMEAAFEKKTLEYQSQKWSYEEICNMEFKTVLNSDCYAYDETTNTYKDLRETDTGLKYLYDNALTLHVVGIVKPNEDAVSSRENGHIGYTGKLTEYMIRQAQNSEAVKKQQEDPSKDIFTNLPFKEDTENMDMQKKAADFKEYINTLSDKEKAEVYIKIKSIPSDEEIQKSVEAALQSTKKEEIEAALSQAMSSQMGMSEENIKKYISSMKEEDLQGIFRQMMTERFKSQYAVNIQQQFAAMTTKQLVSALNRELKKYTEEQCAELYDNILEFSESTYEDNLIQLGCADLSSPSSIHLYASSFENKDAIEEAIAEYNEKADDLHEIEYTDYVGLMMSSITIIINAITYVLIAFVAVSLIVSSIMIGVITLISVQERTKEIGILRAIGASKKNVSGMFNAETVIIGFTSGFLGILITYLLCIPINIILHELTGINNLSAYLPPITAVILILISMLLTLIAGIIPSRSAAKKDPVIALRTE